MSTDTDTDTTALALANTEAAAAGEVLALLEQMEVRHQDDLNFIGDLTIEAHAQHKALTARMEEITKPQYAAWKKTRALFTPALSALEQIEKLAKRKLVEGEKALREQAQAQLVDAVTHVDPALVADALAHVHDPVLPAGLVGRRTRKYRVTDESLVPNKFMTIDHAKLRAAVEALPVGEDGEISEEITGVEVYYEDGIAVRGVK